MEIADVVLHLVEDYSLVALNIIREMGRRLRRTNRFIPRHAEGRVALLSLVNSGSVSQEECSYDV